MSDTEPFPDPNASAPLSEVEWYLLPAGQRHDAYFKRVFSDPDHARSFFRSHLAPELAAAIDWAGLTLLPGSFVETTLEQSHADLLFSVHAAGQEMLLYLLFEHQSSVSPVMPLRLLDYMTRIWLRHSEQHGLPLPPVIPFVLHQGPGAWTVSTAFADMIAFPPGLEAHLTPHAPHFSHALLDLTQSEPATEEHDDALRVVLHLMKCARERQGMLLFFDWLAAQTFVIPDSLTRLSLLYAFMADASLDPKKIAATLKANSVLHKTVMSTAEYLIAQGREEGLLKGRQEGERHGLWVGKLQMLQELMGLPVTDCAELAGLTATELEERFRLLQKEYAVRFKSR